MASGAYTHTHAYTRALKVILRNQACAGLWLVRAWFKNYTVLDFGSDACQIYVQIVQVNAKSAWKISDILLLFYTLVF